jgi:hypothetical protein
MKRFLSAGVFVLALAACNGGDGTSSPTLVSVTISPDNQTIQVGGTLQLAASTLDSKGTNTQNVSAAWVSLSPGVATVSATGLLTGVAAGTVKVTATVRDKVDTATFTVAAPVNCNSAATLSVGQSSVLSGAQATTVCLGGGASGAEYLVMPRFRAGDGSQAFLGLTVTTSGATAATGFNPDRTPVAGASYSFFNPLHRDYGIEALIRRREHELSPLVPGARSVYRSLQGIRRSTSAAAVPAVGDIVGLNASLRACDSIKVRFGRVAAVSQHAIIVADTANPAGGMTDAEYAAFATTFDTLAYPSDTQNFGTETDIDGNGHVVVFYTRAVNELTPAGASSYVGGFFYSRDLFPKTNQPGFTGCAGSNAAEMFYMLAADPNGVVNGNKRSKDLITRTSVATLAHEFQHLINAARRLYIVPNVTGQNWDEVVWLNEGMSHIAEELTFLRSGGLTPGQNFTYAGLGATPRTTSAVNTFQLDNLARFHEFVVSPEANSPYDGNNGGDDLETRGAIWSFLRYAADRSGQDQTQFWNHLVNNNKVGMDNLGDVLATNPDSWFRDWAVSMYLDDTPAATQAIYQQPSWNMRDIITGLYKIAQYPLATRQLAASPVTISLAGGAAAYFKGAVAANGAASVSLTSSTSGFPANVDVVVVRLK